MEYLIADDLSNIPASKDIWNTLSLTIYQNTPVSKEIWNTLSLTIYQMSLSTKDIRNTLLPTIWFEYLFVKSKMEVITRETLK
jgi:hypothetical protein